MTVHEHEIDHALVRFELYVLLDGNTEQCVPMPSAINTIVLVGPMFLRCLAPLTSRSRATCSCRTEVNQVIDRRRQGHYAAQSGRSGEMSPGRAAASFQIGGRALNQSSGRSNRSVRLIPWPRANRRDARPRSLHRERPLTQMRLAQGAAGGGATACTAGKSNPAIAAR